MFSYIRQHLIESSLIAVALTVVLVSGLVLLEPLAARGQASASEQFIVTQTITGEISMTALGDVSLSGINGLTGGTASGSTYTVVRSNDPAGYNMTIAFPYATTSGMQGNTTSSYINNYTPGTPGTPDYTFTANGAGGAAEFGYTVGASTTADLATLFRNNSTVCNNDAGVDTEFECWMNPATTTQTIVNRTSEAGTGATTTIKFQVTVPSNPTPALEVDTYTATVTLTATNNT